MPATPKSQDTRLVPTAKVRRVLRREMLAFFHELQRPEPGWPAVSDQEIIDALADTMLDHGKAQGRGVAHLQTLVHELQDRINSELKG